MGKIFMETPFIIYADLESLLEKISNCHNNPNESSTIKINNDTPSGYSLLTHCSFDNTKICLIIIDTKTVRKCFVST